MPLQEGKGEKRDFLRKDRNLCLSLMQTMWIWFCLPICIRIGDRGRIYDFRRAETGPYYIITGVAGDVRYPGLWKVHSLDIYSAPQPETDNYLVMEAGEDALVVTGYTSDGQEMHKSVIRK